MKRAWILVLVAVGAASCSGPNPEYCQGHQDDPTCHSDGGIDAPVDGPKGCMTDPDCTGSATGNVCNTSTTPGECVQCLPGDSAACVGTSPVCGSDDACRACAAHSECSSDLCFPDGSCDAGSGDIAYVVAGGSGSACSQSAPCGTITVALTTGRPFVKISGTIDDTVTVSGSQSVTFFGDPGATLKRSSAGTTLTVSGAGTALSIYGLTISNGANDVSSIGISAGLGTTINIYRSTITSNAGGGITLDGAQFNIENSFVTGNGGMSSAFGAIKIDGITTAGTYDLDFNTIANNQAASGISTPGVFCVAATQTVNVDSDIVYGNFDTGGTADDSPQITAYSGGTKCEPTYSDIGGSGSATGTGNINANPLFVGPTDTPPNFHLLSGSPCLGAADSSSSNNIDFDGDARPQAGRWDIGADEYTGSGG